MRSAELKARRATLEDIDVLRSMWASMGYNTEALARRVTEFQVVEQTGNGILGAVGLEMHQKQGNIHSEAFIDFALADQLRPLLWNRLHALANNHGIVRLWTQEQAPYWRQAGLARPDEETLACLPELWRGTKGWLTLKLREDVDEILSGDQEIAVFMQAEKRRTEQMLARARVVKTLATVLAFLLLGGVILAAIYLLRRSPNLGLGG